MIVEVRNAFKDNVNGIPWMDKTTKLAVMEKVRSYFICNMLFKVLDVAISLHVNSLVCTYLHCTKYSKVTVSITFAHFQGKRRNF